MIADMAAAPTSSTSVLAKAARILETFGPHDRSLSLSEIARRSGIAKSTAHRVTTELIEFGFLERGTYGLRLGLKMFELGQLAAQPRSIRELTGTTAVHLRDTTRHTIHVGILSGYEVIYVDKLCGGTAMPALPTRIGGRMPAHATAIGKVLLAHADPADVPSEPDLPRLTRSTLSSRPRLAAALDEARETGLAFDREEAVAGVQCVAGVIRGSNGYPVAAVSVSGPTGHISLDRCAKTLQAATRAVGDRLQKLGA